MFRLRKIEEDPIGIDLDKDSKFQIYKMKNLKGKWWRVHPTNMKEITALAILSHREEKYAAAHGGGILVSQKALEKFKLSSALE